MAVIDLRRQARHLAGAAFGVVVSVAGLVFFLALAMGVREVLLGEVFPVDRIEVAPRSRNVDLLALRFALGSDTLSAEMLGRIGHIAGVAAVYPKMKLAVPALASGGESLLGAAMQTEVVVDGIDPSSVVDEVGESFAWSEFDPAVQCVSNHDCPEDAYCGDGAYGTAGQCRRFVPVLVSHHLLEMYNGSFRRAYRLPRLNPDFAVGLHFEMSFGASTLRGSARRQVVRERMRLAGFSERAIPLGVTLPLDFVRDLYRIFGSDDAVDTYHSAIVLVADKAAVPRVVEAVRAMDLVVKDSGAERAAILIAVLMFAITIVGGAMIAVATIGVAHAFFMVVLGRQREIGVLRAVGARRSDVRRLLVGEAALVGAAAGTLGVSLAIAAAAVGDRVAAAQLPDFPYKPESFFQFPVWLGAGAIALAVVACMAGAALPARRAAARDPAEALTST
jgi:ABC-type lipoprotein release transport system permease subunit